MSVLDTAKEIARISSAAGLGKDVIDLLEKKITLLTEQVLALERENSQLKVENSQLRQQLQMNMPQKEVLTSEERKILEFLNATGGDDYMDYQIVARHVGVDLPKARFLFDQLEVKGYVWGSSYSPPGYRLTPDGRELIYKS